MGHEHNRSADFLSVQVYVYTKVTLPNLRQAKMAVKFVLIKSCALVVLMTNQLWLPVIHKENTDHRSYYFSSDQSNHAKQIIVWALNRHYADLLKDNHQNTCIRHGAANVRKLHYNPRELNGAQCPHQVRYSITHSRTVQGTISSWQSKDTQSP